MTTEPRDELLERYADAVAQDPRRPSDRVRNAARAHAQMLRDQAAAVQRVAGNAPTKAAANQSQWTVSLVASLAVVGLAGLIFIQIDRGTPDVREAALGAAAPSPVAAPAMPPIQAPTEAAAVTVARKEATPSPAPRRAPVQVAAQATGNVASVRADAAPPPPPPQPAEAEMAARSDNKMADQAAGAAPREARAQAHTESLARMAPPVGLLAAAPAAPAAMAPPSPAVTAAAAPPAAVPQRAREMESAPPTALYLDAARTGNTAVLQQMLERGVAINTRDDTGNTALMLAVRHRQASVVRTLLAMGADTRLTNHEDMTALQLANQLGLADMAQLLQAPR